MDEVDEPDHEATEKSGWSQNHVWFHSDVENFRGSGWVEVVREVQRSGRTRTGFLCI